MATPPAGSVDPSENGRTTVAVSSGADPMAEREAVRDDVADAGEREREPQRREDEIGDRLAERLAGDHLDHPARHAEAGVVIAPGRARRRELHVRREPRHEALERLVAMLHRAQLPFPAARVREQVPQRHVAARGIVLHAEVGQVGAHRRAQIELPLLHQAHHRHRRHRLGDRRQRKDRAGGDRQRILDARDAEAANRGLAVAQDPERDAGHVILAHLRGHEIRDGVERAIGRRLGARNRMWRGSRSTRTPRRSRGVGHDASFQADSMPTR